MVEELLHADAPVLAVGHTDGPVGFAGVVEEPGGLAEALEGHEHLDALVPRHVSVLVVVHDEDGGIDLVHAEQRTVFGIDLGMFPHRGAEAALGVFVLETACQAGTPADAAVGAEHVDHGSTALDGCKAIGARGEVGALIATPAVSAGADVPAIDEAQALHLVETRKDAVVGRLAGMSVGVADVGYEDEIAVAGEGVEVADRALRRGHAVVEERLAVALVVIDDERILPGGVEVGRLEEETFEGDALVAGPLDGFGRSPEERLLLGFEVGQTDGLTEGEVSGVEVGATHVGIMFEGAFGPKDDGCILGLGGQGAEHEAATVEGKGPGGTLEGGAEVARAFGRLVEGAQHLYFLGLEAIAFLLLVEAQQTVLALLLTSVERQSGWHAALGRDAPDVVAIVEEQRLVVVEPACCTIRLGVVGVVVLLVPAGEGLGRGDAPTQARGQFDGVPATVGEVVSVGVVAQGGDAVGGVVGLGDRATFARGDIDDGVVATRHSFPHRTERVGLRVGEQAIAAVGIVVACKGRIEAVGKLDDTSVGKMTDGHEGALAFAVLLIGLHGVLHGFVPAPDLHIGTVAPEGKGVGLTGSSSGAEEEAAAVLREVELAVGAQHEALGEGVVDAVGKLADFAIGGGHPELATSALRLLLVGGAPEEGELRAVFAEGDAFGFLSKAFLDEEGFEGFERLLTSLRASIARSEGFEGFGTLLLHIGAWQGEHIETAGVGLARLERSEIERLPFLRKSVTINVFERFCNRAVGDEAHIERAVLGFELIGQPIGLVGNLIVAQRVDAFGGTCRQIIDEKRVERRVLVLLRLVVASVLFLQGTGVAHGFGLVRLDEEISGRLGEREAVDGEEGLDLPALCIEQQGGGIAGIILDLGGLVAIAAPGFVHDEAVLAIVGDGTVGDALPLHDVVDGECTLLGQKGQHSDGQHRCGKEIIKKCFSNHSYHYMWVQR